MSWRLKGRCPSSIIMGVEGAVEEDTTVVTVPRTVGDDTVAQEVDGEEGIGRNTIYFGWYKLMR